MQYIQIKLFLSKLDHQRVSLDKADDPMMAIYNPLTIQLLH